MFAPLSDTRAKLQCSSDPIFSSIRVQVLQQSPTLQATPMAFPQVPLARPPQAPLAALPTAAVAPVAPIPPVAPAPVAAAAAVQPQAPPAAAPVVAAAPVRPAPFAPAPIAPAPVAPPRPAMASPQTTARLSEPEAEENPAEFNANLDDGGARSYGMQHNEDGKKDWSTISQVHGGKTMAQAGGMGSAGPVTAEAGLDETLEDYQKVRVCVFM